MAWEPNGGGGDLWSDGNSRLQPVVRPPVRYFLLHTCSHHEGLRPCVSSLAYCQPGLAGGLASDVHVGSPIVLPSKQCNTTYISTGTSRVEICSCRDGLDRLHFDVRAIVGCIHHLALSRARRCRCRKWPKCLMHVGWVSKKRISSRSELLMPI